MAEESRWPTGVGSEAGRRKAPSPFWIKILLASLVFVALTSGVKRLPSPWRKRVVTHVDHWLQANSRLPQWPRQMVLPSWLRARLGMGPLAASGAPSSWSWVASGAPRVVRAFGWYHPGLHAKFSKGVTLAFPAGTVIRSGPGGTILQVASTAGHTFTVEEQVGAHQILRYQGLATTTVSQGQHLGANRRLGTAGTQPLTIEVLVHGYPVNPFSRQLFGQPKGLVR